MLLQLREFIKQQQVVSLQQLIREFRTDEAALTPMLAVWVRRGAIVFEQQDVACKSACFRCGGKTLMVRWNRNII